MLEEETPTQVFSCEFSKICKNNFFHRTPLVATPIELHKIKRKWLLLVICKQHGQRDLYFQNQSSGGVLKNFAKFIGNHLCQSLFLIKLQASSLQLCNFIKKENLAHVVSCKF